MRPLTPGEQYNQELQQELLAPTPQPKVEHFTIIPPIDDARSGGYPSYGTTFRDGTTIITNPDGDSTYIIPQGRR